jgi:hypothetical protein
MPLPGIEPQPSLPKPVATPTELSRTTGGMLMAYFSHCSDMRLGGGLNKMMKISARSPGVELTPPPKFANTKGVTYDYIGLLFVLYCHMCCGIGDWVWWRYHINITCHFICTGMLASICWSGKQQSHAWCADMSSKWHEIHPILTNPLTQSIRWTDEGKVMPVCTLSHVFIFETILWISIKLRIHADLYEAIQIWELDL